MFNNFVQFIGISNKDRYFESTEVSHDDEVFSSDVFYNSNSFNNISENELYHRPDYTKHVVSTMGKGLTVLNERNIALPIRESSNMDLLGLNRCNEEDRDKSGGRGVYVIERFLIHDILGVDVEELVKYYSNITNFSSNTLKNVRSNIFNCTPNSPVVIRLVTFIPEHDIEEYKYVYSSTTNLAIINGSPNNHTVHPDSYLMREKKSKDVLNDLDHPTVIILEVIDNDNPHKPYFINVGDEPYRILSTMSTTKPNGANIKIKLNDKIKRDVSVIDKKDFSNVGIYDTLDEAVIKGDVDKIITMKKLNQEDKKLLQEDKKLNQEDNKLKISVMKLKQEALVLEYNKIKLTHDKYALNIDKELKKITYKNTLVKFRFDYINHQLTLDREAMLFEQKMLQEEQKNIGSTISLLGTGMKLLGSFL